MDQKPKVLEICHLCRRAHDETLGWVSKKAYRAATGIESLMNSLLLFAQTVTTTCLVKPEQHDCPSRVDFQRALAKEDLTPIRQIVEQRTTAQAGTA